MSLSTKQICSGVSIKRINILVSLQFYEGNTSAQEIITSVYILLFSFSLQCRWLEGNFVWIWGERCWIKYFLTSLFFRVNFFLSKVFLCFYNPARQAYSAFKMHTRWTVIWFKYSQWNKDKNYISLTDSLLLWRKKVFLLAFVFGSSSSRCLCLWTEKSVTNTNRLV